MKIFVCVLLVGSTLFFAKDFTSAANDTPILDSDITATLSPENPQPSQDITITLSSFATDLNKDLIQWQNGSAIVLSGYGKTSYSFKALGANSVTILDISIQLPGGGQTISKRVVINPTEVDLIWEGVDSYTPPFYRGKSFPSAEGLIKVVAIPHTPTIKQGKGALSYTWKTGDSTELGVSGYNKDSFVFKNSELNDGEKVSVIAESVNGQYSATNTIKIPIVEPKIIFYKKSPTEGVLYNQALGTETYMSEDGATIVVEPYFLALKGNEDDFSYNWKINGKSVNTPPRKTEITIRPSDRGGYATINIMLENLKTLYQKASGELKINL